MKKNNKSSQSSKRYRYSSFRDKIENLRIEPARDLSKKAHQHVDTSHLLSSFEHWEDINMSANFTAVADDMRSLIQTLPQILHHKVKIFDLLQKNISKHDHNSLQPLLDLLAQFCHDLGPDFIEYYDRTIILLIELVDDATDTEASDIFEWGFDCLAYIFKYLSRVLAKDPLPTFTQLFPLLSHPKDYLQRFSAEALSYLLRKCQLNVLLALVKSLFERAEGPNGEAIYDGIVTLFTESILNTKGTLHSRGGIILKALFQEAMECSADLRSISLFSDILMNVLRHASIEDAKPVYELLLAEIEEGLDRNELSSCPKVVKILVTLSFAESGKKVPDWSRIVNNVEKLMAPAFRESLSHQSTSLLFATLFRNLPIPKLTQFYRKAFQFFLAYKPVFFLTFYQLTSKLDQSRLISFSGEKYLQGFIDEHWRKFSEPIALYVSETSSNECPKNLKIPNEFSSSLLNDIDSFGGDLSADKLPGIFWRLKILKLSTTTTDAVLKPLFEKLIAKPHVSDFEKDVLGTLAQTIKCADVTIGTELALRMIKNFGKFPTNLECIIGLRRLVNLFKTESLSTELTHNHAFLLQITDNLVFADQKLRYESLKLLLAAMELAGLEVRREVYELKLVEESPHTLETARDLSMRIRKVGTAFSTANTDELTCHIIFKLLFGLLTVRFSPLWEGIYASFPELYGKNSKLMWSLFLRFLNFSDYTIKYDYSIATEADDCFPQEWSVGVKRLNDVLVSSKEIDSQFQQPVLTILRNSREKTCMCPFPELIRNQALKGLLLIPSLAEQHSRDIIPYLFNRIELEEVFLDDSSSGVAGDARQWSDQDRSMLLKLVAKFKNIRSIFKSSEVHGRMLDLLKSRNENVQRLAFNVLMAYKEPIAMIYKDNLKNLLDPALFKDEIIKLISNAETSVLKPSDEDFIMPYILRILYGRAQVKVTSGMKKSSKSAVMTILPSLREKHVVDFVRLGSSKIEYNKFFEEDAENPMSIQGPIVDDVSLRKMTGFIKLCEAIIAHIRSRFLGACEEMIKPIVFAILSSNSISNGNDVEAHQLKAASNLRQAATKCLALLFEVVGDSLDWSKHISIIYRWVVEPRLKKFDDENLQQPSSIMRVMVSWSDSTKLHDFLYHDNFVPIKALLKVLRNKNAKSSTVEMVLSFCNRLLQSEDVSERYEESISHIAETCLLVLPKLLEGNLTGKALNTSIEILLKLTEANLVNDDVAKKGLIDSITLALSKSNVHEESQEKVKLLKILSFIIPNYECEWSEVEQCYKACATQYSVAKERNTRLALNDVFVSISKRFSSVSTVSRLLCDINSYSLRQMETYNFERILPAFKIIGEEYYTKFSDVQWLPILHCSLFFLQDLDELALRTNASFLLKRFIDYINVQTAKRETEDSIQLLKAHILPNLKQGLRRKNDDVKSEYVGLLGYIVKNSQRFTEFEDMKVLLFNNDEEANVFENVVHIQLHRRQRAIRRLAEQAPNLKSTSIAHYLIPMIEAYMLDDTEKFRNIKNEAIHAMHSLAGNVTWHQYKALFRRYLSLVRVNAPFLAELVSVIIELSRPLESCRNSTGGEDSSSGVAIREMPRSSDSVEKFIQDEIMPKVSGVMKLRDDETAVLRIPLAEALVHSILALDHQSRILLLPAILTGVCQVLRSRSEELREAARRVLTKITQLLGPDYFVFIVKELKSALQRGSQIHVLSYTVHHLLVELNERLESGDLDVATDLLVSVIMEDLFGSASEEKEAEGYASKAKMKEVKFNKSYDTGELLASKISLQAFGSVIHPIKVLLSEQLSLKTQRKLDELLRRYALGLNHNTRTSSIDALTMCYEIYMQSTRNQREGVAQRNEDMVKGTLSDSSKFFLVDLKARKDKVLNDPQHLLSTLQKFAFDLLRTTLVRNKDMLIDTYLEGFIPLLQEALSSDDEGLLLSTLRLLIVLAKGSLSEAFDGLFKNSARKTLTLIKESPSTSTEICQMSLKYLSIAIRHREIGLKETALGYILNKIKPDLNEPNKQGLAFGFLRSLISKHVMIAEIYDVAGVVSEVMVTNHSREIRDISRSVFYQFLMEYDQSRGRLEKQFKFMLSNLEYPSQEGRQSVMELLNLIVNKSSDDLLKRLSSSFFLSLASVSLNDSSPRCREMASSLISNIVEKLGFQNVITIEKYVIAWLKQNSPSFSNLGLRIAKILYATLGFGQNDQMDLLVIERINGIFAETDVGSGAEWDIVYTAHNILEVLATRSTIVYEARFEIMWRKVIMCLLFPHPWVRSAAARLINLALRTQKEFSRPFNVEEIQLIATRTLRQIGAPSLSETLAELALKNLTIILSEWRENTPNLFDAAETEGAAHVDAIDFVISRTASMLRKEPCSDETFVSKKTCIQFFALAAQLLSAAKLAGLAYKIMMGLYMFLEFDDLGGDEKVQSLRDLSQECLQILESKMNISDYTTAFTKVKQEVIKRRQERKARRATLAVANPEIAARRKLKKHARSREKRKHEKDASGFYRPKRSKNQ
ncbi:LAMI_0C07646g1_1 [Lachancea mirantina]|uniref:LAMI_0C07646g1_1 n=1 Tax=Lachancea mirantina TaxID=1230905 RepID=A0A1G4J3Z5_9SACH|nr:LAMI_0C07646g1_1 [Lachancea mirantina]